MALTPGARIGPYAAAEDEQRFLANTLGDDPNASPNTVILNWQAEK